MKRISIKKPIWFIDNKNGNIYWFKEIKGNKINGLEFLKHTYKINQAGDWDFDKWKHVISISAPNRFRKLDFSKLTRKRKYNMIKGTMKYRI